MTAMNCASVLLLVSSYWTQTTVGFTYAPSAISHAIQTIVAESRLEARRKKQENDDPKGQSPQVDPAKRAALDGVLTQIERSYGRGSIVQLGSAAHMEVASISSGALTLDAALGGGGFPKGRVVEIYGPESSGKTTLALHAIAESQKQGGIAAFVDAEHALDPQYGEYYTSTFTLVVGWRVGHLPLYFPYDPFLYPWDCHVLN